MPEKFQIPKLRSKEKEYIAMWNLVHLRDLRQAKGLTQNEVVVMTGLSPYEILRAESLCHYTQDSYNKLTTIFSWEEWE